MPEYNWLFFFFLMDTRMQNYGTVGITVAEMTARSTAGIWTGFCVLFTTGPISNSAEIPYSVSETLPCTLSLATPIQFCIHGQTKKKSFFSPSEAYLFGREEQGNRWVVKATNYFTTQDQYLEVRQLSRPWWTGVGVWGQVVCVVYTC